MRQLQITISLLIALISQVSAQNKIILGDTSFCYQCFKPTLDKLGIKDFYTSQDDFNFRFRNHGQIVEINKTNDSVSGVLINYIFKIKSKNYQRTDTLFNKVKLTNREASKVIEIINNSKILDLESMDNIEKWTLGFDGTVYNIEHSNQNEYYYKSYWSPGAQDSLPESLIVLNFIQSLSDTLNLPDRYSEFKETIPQTGCYNSGGISMMCFIPNSYGFGLIGSTRLPLGYQISIYQLNFRKYKLDMVFYASHQLDFSGQHDINTYIGKGNIFFREFENFADFVGYSFRYRKLLNRDIILGYSNNKAYYGLTIKRKFDIAGGIDYLNADEDEIGGLIYVSQWFSKPAISLVGTTSIYNNHADYKFGISKSFYFNRRLPISSIAIGLDYEKFYDFEDLRISLMIRL